MRVLPGWLLLLSLALVLSACGGGGGSSSDPQPDVQEDVAPDVEEDVAPDAEEDVAPDVEEDAEPDVDEEVWEPVGACTIDADCATDHVCLASACYPALPCRNSGAWPECVRRYSEVDEVVGERAYCVERLCRVGCHLDEHCPAGQSCTDWGTCRPFDGVLAPYGSQAGTRAPLQAGVGVALQRFPIGLPLGGYGSRSGGAQGRYNVSLSASIGALHQLDTRAVVLDNGEHKVMLIRTPLIFTGSDIHELVARALQERTGYDWRDSLLISSTHSHSGPARHWPLPAETAIPIGILGIGEYSEQARQWVVQTIVEAAGAALDDLSPARFGWEILEAFDTDDAIARDRWSQTPPMDDNRLLLLRVDDAEGNPRAAMVSFGMHPTVNSSDYACNDVMLSVETELEDGLAEAFGRTVPVLYINQNSGSMSPANDGQAFPFALERTGIILRERAMDTLLAIETSDDISLRSRTFRFPITYGLLGYEGRQWRENSDRLPLGGVFFHGGLQCDMRAPEPGAEPNTVMGCINPRFLFFNRAPTTFQKTQISAFEIDGLSVVTAPGELTMELGWQFLAALEERFGIDPLRAWTWGFAQDHLLYLVPTNLRGPLPPFPGISTPQPFDDYPEYTWSWWAGGYEAQMNTWGWRLGDYLVERAVEAWGRMVDPDYPVAVAEQLPVVYADPGHPPFELDASDPARVGTLVQDVPTQVRRFESMEFAWIGGDAIAEMPQVPLVTLEAYDPDEDTWSVPGVASLRPYTNRENRFVTRRRVVDGEPQWVARWEELKSFPAGTYRFRIDGHYFTRANDASSRTAYTVRTRSFTLEPATLEMRAAADGRGVQIAYPAPLPFRFAAPPPVEGDRGDFAGSFRLRHPLVRPGELEPLFPEADLTLDGVEAHYLVGATPEPVEAGDLELVLDTSVRPPLSSVRLRQGVTPPVGATALRVQVTDRHGNGGTFDLSLP